MKEAIGAHAESGLHLLRHTFLTHAAGLIKNVRTLQLIAGHANIATTMKYIHPSEDDMADALAACDQVEVEAAKDEQIAVCPNCGTEIAECKQSLQFSLQRASSEVLNMGVSD